MTPALVTLLTGALLLVTSFCVGLYEILLQPENANYRNGRRRERAAWFCVSGAFLYRGAEIINGLAGPDPVYVTFGTCMGTLAVAAAFALQLEQLLRQWLPARLQRRIQQLLDVASCGHRRKLKAERERNMAAVWGDVPAPADASVVGAALAELALQGARVVGPNEPPSALDR